MGTASGTYRMVQTVSISGNVPTLVDKWGALYPGSLLHKYLPGVVADDLSYIGSPAAVISAPDSATFKVQNVPSNLISATMKVRMKITGADPETFESGIILNQGDDKSGPEIALIEFPDDIPGGAAAAVLDTWYDLSVVVNIASITDVTDLHIDCRLLVNGATINRGFMSWLVLVVTFPYGRAEVPTNKNYVNSLTPISPPPSARAVGTAGTSKYCYRVVPFDASGVDGPTSDEIIIETGHATLDVTNHVCLSWLDVDDAAGYKVYRTCAPTGYGLGLLDTVLPDEG
ncbi:hypothetical protein LCGC14_2967120, partial [marine sediment metagenome]